MRIHDSRSQTRNSTRTTCCCDHRKKFHLSQHPQSHHRYSRNNNNSMDYPNLQSCRVTIQSERSIAQPPVRLPVDITQQLQRSIPKPIDFALEHLILKKKSERDKEYGLLSSNNNRDELRKNLIARMESLTHASEDVCVSILEQNSYNLETSVEAYLSDSRPHMNH